MSKLWLKVKLSEVLTPVSRAEKVDLSKEYRLLGVRLDGNGPFVRETVLGSQTSATRLYQVREGDFIYSRLFACRGAFGVIPKDLDGCYVSGEFPTFLPIKERIDIEFLRCWFRLADVISRVDENCSGSTPLTRNRFKEENFLQLALPLPSLIEQQRIVVRIEKLAALVRESTVLRHGAADDAEALLRSILEAADCRLTPLRELLQRRELDVVVDPDEIYKFAGVYCFGRGVFRGPVKRGSDFSYKALTRIRTNDFTYPKLMAWEGAFGLTPPECDGLVVSPEFPVFTTNPDRLLPAVLDIHFKTPSVWPLVAGQSTGTNVRRRRLNPSDFLDYRFPVPPMETQRRLVEVRAQVDALKLLQAETAAELDAMLPAILDKAFRGDL